MNTFTIFDNNSLTQLYVEEEAYEGVKRIGARVACDLGLVTGTEPGTVSAPCQCRSDRVVIFAAARKEPVSGCARGIRQMEQRTDPGKKGGLPDAGGA